MRRLGIAVRSFDDAVERAFDRVRSPALDPIAYGLSTVADRSLLWHALGLWQAVRAGEPRRALRFSAALGFESALTNGVVKSLFARVRPDNPVPEGPLPYGMRRPITTSFPSGHATAAFCAAVLLSPGRRPAARWLALATAVAASRVYVRMHHASDVVAGAVLGLGLGAALRPRVDGARSRRAG